MYYNIIWFGFGQFDAYKPATETKTKTKTETETENFGFYEMNTETKSHQNLGNNLSNFGRFF